MNYNQQKSKGDCSYTIPLDVGVKVVRGRSIDEDYDVGDEIGIGSDGVVKICQDRKTGEEFCCKLMEKWNYPQRIRAEVDMMCRLSAHPGIVKLHAVYEDFKSGNLVMELCSGGTLTDVMHEKRRPFSEDEARKIMKELWSQSGIVTGWESCTEI